MNVMRFAWLNRFSEGQEHRGVSHKFPISQIPLCGEKSPRCWGAPTQGGERIRNHTSSFPPSADSQNSHPARFLPGRDVVSLHTASHSAWGIGTFFLEATAAQLNSVLSLKPLPLL